MAQVAIGCNTVSSAVCSVIVSIAGLMSMCALDLYPMYSPCCYSERRREGKGEMEGGEGKERERERGGGREGEGERGRERGSCQ